MSLRRGLGRLAFSVLDNKGWIRKSISSCAYKCEPTTASRAQIPPLVTLNYLKAPNHQPVLIDPGLTRLPKGILDVPVPGLSRIVDIPLLPIVTTIPPINPVVIEDPTKVIEQQAARLIVIRRRKMRRHKLKKLRIRMKFEWAKRRQKRELKKEKLFQAELMGKIREAEKFDAAAFAAAKIEKSNQVPIPKLWKGKRLPEFLIKELLVEKHRRHMEYLERQARREKRIKKVADYKDEASPPSRLQLLEAKRRLTLVKPRGPTTVRGSQFTITMSLVKPVRSADLVTNGLKLGVGHACALNQSQTWSLTVGNRFQPALRTKLSFIQERHHADIARNVRLMSQLGDLGSGAGKGGGGGGSIRSAGGSFGKMEAAHEEEYFYKQQREQLEKLKGALTDEISFHEEQIKRHQEAINRTKNQIGSLHKE